MGVMETWWGLFLGGGLSFGLHEKKWYDYFCDSILSTDVKFVLYLNFAKIY